MCSSNFNEFKKQYLDNADVKLKLKFDPFEKDGEMYVKITKFKLAFTIGKFNIKLDNLFNGE